MILNMYNQIYTKYPHALQQGKYNPFIILDSKRKM